MAIKKRHRKTGRATSDYDRLELYTITRGLLQRAAGPDGNPYLVTEDAWSVARPGSAWPDAPEPPTICRRLCSMEGEPIAWEELRELVLDPDFNPARFDIARTRRARNPRLHPRVAYYALRRVAQELGQNTVTWEAYTSTAGLLIFRGRKRNPQIAACFPSAGQINELFGSWPLALQYAQLEWRQEHYTAGRVPLAEAACRFYRITGLLPTAKQLRMFAHDYNFALEDVDSSQRWETHIAGFHDYIVEHGYPAPPPYAPDQQTPRWQRPSPEEAAALRTDGEREYTRKRFWPHKSEVLAKLQEFSAEGVPVGGRWSTGAYKRWARAEPDRPSLETVQSFAPLDAMLREARKPGAIERARAEEARAAATAPEEREQRLHNKHINSRKGQAILALLRDRGPLIRRDLEDATGYPQRTVSTYLDWLEDAGAISRLGNTNRDARYALTESRAAAA